MRGSYRALVAAPGSLEDYGKTLRCPSAVVSQKGSVLLEMEEGLCSQDPREC